MNAAPRVTGGRLLIVNADDFGMYPRINAAVVEAFDHGIVTSCSVMVPTPGAGEAIGILRRRPDLPFGVHLTLVRDSDWLAWGPAAGRDAVPSLVDDTGEFPLAVRADDLLQRARVDEVEIELRAQIRTVLEAGLAPTHLDWHCLADGGRADPICPTSRGRSPTSTASPSGCGSNRPCARPARRAGR